MGVSRQTLYRYVGPDGELREYGGTMLLTLNSSFSTRLVTMFFDLKYMNDLHISDDGNIL